MVDTVGFNLKLENGQFKVSLKEAERLMESLGKKVEDTNKRGEKSTGGFIDSLKNLKASTIAAYAAVAGIAAGIYGLGKSFLSAAAGAEKNQVAFSTLLKSADKAKALLGDLQKWANVSPFGMESATAGAKRLLAFGVSAENIIGTMTRLGDASMGDAEILDRLTLAYGKISAKGVASMEELNQLTEAGVPILDTLAKGYGVTTTAVMKMVENGKVGFKEVDAALTNLTTGSGQFAGMMEKQSQTLEGMWSTFKDSMAGAAREAGSDMLPVFKELLTNLSDKDGVMAFITGAFKALAMTLNFAVGALNYFLKSYNEFAKAEKEHTKNADLRQRYDDARVALSKLTPGMSGYKNAVLEVNAALQEYVDLELTNAKNNKDLIEANKGNAYMVKLHIELYNQATANVAKYRAEMEKLNRTIGGSSSPGGGPRPTPASPSVTPSAPAAAAKGEQWIGTPNYGGPGFTTGIMNETKTMVGELDSIMQQATQNELDRIDIRRQKKLDALNAEYQAEVERINNSTMSQKQKDAALKAADEKRARDQKAIDDKAAKDKRKIEHDAAKRKKAMDITNTIIAGAVGMIAAFQMGPIAGAIFAALIGAMTIAAVATIASQPLPPLATGTMTVPEDMPAFLHQGEAVVPKPFAEGLRSGEMSLGGGGTGAMTINQNIYLDGNPIYSGAERYLLAKAANRGTSIYNNA